MVNECCTNDLCVSRETQLRFARLREDLLTNFNSLLVDRIRFLEQTISQLSTKAPSTITVTPTTTTTEKRHPPEIVITDRLPAPTTLRRSISATDDLFPTLKEPSSTGDEGRFRWYPSSDDLSALPVQRKWFLSVRLPSRSKDRSSFASNRDYLSPPIVQRQYARSTNDIPSTTTVNNDKGRLDSRRFACDVDDNDVRAFKARVYTEQARKQHVRPLTRLRQALRISTSKSTGNFTTDSSKK
jgi:hypothetical protein